MIKSICMLLGGISETIITMYFFEFKYSLKAKKITAAAAGMCFSAVCFCVDMSDALYLKPIVLFICGLIFSVFLYRARIMSAIFTNASLSVILVLSQLGTIYFLSSVFDTDIKGLLSSSLMLTVINITTLSIFLAAVYVIVRFADRKEQLSSKISFSLLLAPISSAAISFAMLKIYMDCKITDEILLIFAAGNGLLLISNTVTVYVHEFSLKSLRYADNIKNENQNYKNQALYYSKLKEQNEDFRVLIHDISKHLSTIGQMSYTDESITDYISSISDDFSVSNPVDYSSNSTLNLITHKFFEKCKSNMIRFDVNIREAKIDFMSAPDITALFDNMLENAFESAVISDERYIDFSVYVRNKNFVIIRLINSCCEKPEYSNGELTTKKKSPLHGIGTKSIKRVVKKYDGNIDMKFKEEERIFQTTVMLHANYQLYK